MDFEDLERYFIRSTLDGYVFREKDDSGEYMLADDVVKAVDESKKEMHGILKDNFELREQNIKLKNENAELHKENQQLKDKCDRRIRTAEMWKRKYEELLK